jgi:sirohydrochlorin ferrochelatase
MIAVRRLGARRIVAVSYFLAPGLLHTAAVREVRAAGALGVAEPLGTTDEVVRLVVQRGQAARTVHTKKAPVFVPGQTS